MAKKEATTEKSNKQSFKKVLRERQELLFIVPVFFTVLSIGALMTWGLKPGIDLAGGSMLQVSYEEPKEIEELQSAVSSLEYGEIRIQTTGEEDFMLRQRELTNDEKNALLEALNTVGKAEEVQFNSIGPILFIAFALRHVSKPVSSWKYGLVAVITLGHDVLIPTGLFAYLGFARDAEVGVFFIVAILATLGISINDTIVVFDRIRENLRLNEEKHRGEAFKDIVWNSVLQTLARSMNTTITVVIMLIALFILGPESTRDFALTLTVGMVAGTYSSVLLASPLLVQIEKHQKPPKDDEK
jgi:preprotein translocase subunit SecF